MDLYPELLESEDRYRKAFFEAPIGMILASVDGRCLRVNQAFCQWLGFSEDELLQTDIISLAHPADKEKSIQFLEELLSGKDTLSAIENRYIGKNGGTLWVYLTATVIRDERGNPIYIVAYIQ